MFTITLTCPICNSIFTTINKRTKCCSVSCGNKLDWQKRAEDVDKRFWSKVNKTDTCWLWTGYVTGNYGRFYINGATVAAHRYSFEQVNGPIKDGHFACHNCPGGDNPLCVNPAHLFEGTPKENMQDMISKGRQRWLSGDENPIRKNPALAARGSRKKNAKINEDTVRVIRKLYATGTTITELAKQYNYKPDYMGRIVHGQRWGHVA